MITKPLIEILKIYLFEYEYEYKYIHKDVYIYMRSVKKHTILITTPVTKIIIIIINILIVYVARKW